MALLMILVTIIFRVLPHPANFSPVSAIAIFGGAYLKKRYAIILPLIIMIFSDYLLLYIKPYQIDFSEIKPIIATFHSTTFYVWGSFVISGLLGLLLRGVLGLRKVI